MEELSTLDREQIERGELIANLAKSIDPIINSAKADGLGEAEIAQTLRRLADELELNNTTVKG